MAQMLDLSALALSHQNLMYLEGIDNSIRLRRLRTLLTISNSIYHSRTTIPPGFRPAKYQLSPLNLLNRPWLENVIPCDTADGTRKPKYPRKGILLSDEGGMGKTLSSAIIALDELYKNPHQSIVVICPKLLIGEWMDIFSHTPFDVHKITGDRLVSGNLRAGINILSKHALLGHHSGLEHHQGEISLLILDEAHDGFIVDPPNEENNQNELAPLSNSIRLLSSKADRLILATATPMRNGNIDLFRLCALIQEDITTSFPTLDDSWFDDLGNIWLPALEDLRRGNDLENSIHTIQENADRFVPLDTDELDVLREYLTSDFEGLNSDQLHELAIDLHPLGKFLSVTLRDDLGHEVCQNLFRTMTSETFIFETEVADNISEQIEEFLSTNAPSNWKGEYASCPMNAVNKRYKIGKYLGEINQLNRWETEINDSWSQDERLIKLKNIIHNELQNPVDTSQGIVLFSTRVGTNQSIKTKLTEEFGERIRVFLFHPPIDQNGYDSRKNSLNQARALSERGDVLPIILSGESGSVGQNMEWATVMVHWDAIKSPAMIAQKSWRLDRRIAHWEHVTREFTSYHFIKEGTQQASILNVNSMYQKQRRLLSDRRFFLDEQVPNLIHEEQGGRIRHQYSEMPRETIITYPEANWLYRFIIGEIENKNCHSAEIMAWSAMIELTGFDFWNNMTAQEMMENSSLRPQNHLENNMGNEKKILHALISITTDPIEQKSLIKFAGGTERSKPIILQSSHEMMDTKRPYLLPTPTGELISFFQERIASQAIETPYYPFSLAAKDFENHDSEFKLLAHKGILNLNSITIGKSIRKVRGERTHCGLIRQNSDGTTRYLTFEDLNDELYIELFEIIATLSDKNVYPHDFFPQEVDVQADIENVLENSDYRDFYVPPAFEGNDLIFGMPQEEFMTLAMWRGNEDEMPLQSSDNDHIIPLVHVHESEEERDDEVCPICQLTESPGCCQDWEPADDYEDENFSGWL
jgi:hypothetical protein